MLALLKSRALTAVTFSGLILLGVTAFASAAPGATQSSSPCRNDSRGAVLLDELKRELVEHGGYPDSAVVVVSDSVTCAAGVAAYNSGVAANLHIADAYIIRRGTDGYVLIPPREPYPSVYYSSTWSAQAVLE